MIPIRITLRNFMSYGDAPTILDFTGIHVASLCGDNGNGKSAILDAVTYALWGKTRASLSQASGEDHLVRLGSQDMEVVFEFRVGDDHYRSTRKRSTRTRSGDWQLHLRDDLGVWRPAGGTGMADTARHLVRLLKMEYETFLNSAYIQQGRADEFTRQKPNDRKRILGDILDLHRYDRLEEMAKERKAACDLDLKDLDGEIRHLEARASERPELVNRLGAAEAVAADAEAARDAAGAEQATLMRTLAVLETAGRAVQELEDRCRVESSRLNSAVRKASDLDGQIARLRTAAGEAEVLRVEMTELQRNRAIMEKLEPVAAKLNAGITERARLQADIGLARQQLERELDRAEAELQRIEACRAQIDGIDYRLIELGIRLDHFGSAAFEREAARSELEALGDRFTELAGESKRLKREIADTDEVIRLLAEPKPSCPVCESDLTDGRHEAVLARQRRKRADLEAELSNVNRLGKEAKLTRDALTGHIDTLEEQVRSEAALRGQRAELLSNRQNLISETSNAENVASVISNLRSNLESAAYAHESRALLEKLEVDLERMSDSAARYAEASLIARSLTDRNVERRLADAEQAAKSIPDALEAAESLRRDRELLVASMKELTQALDGARTETAELESARAAASQSAARLQEANKARDAAIGQVERIRHALNESDKAGAAARLKSDERNRVSKDRQAYVELAAAFGKRGVQAHIIDSALPEVQDEANRLLARLTDSAMQVTLSTVRTARTGGSQIETLDISITDEAGARPYEMYSGGEAFRVNFAIRIALSRLLARRAGARLHTLILDEGFGTQDAKGRERLIEAIEAVKDEFALILVISHLDDLKSAFPTRIEVSKPADGSRIDFVE